MMYVCTYTIRTSLRHFLRALRRISFNYSCFDAFAHTLAVLVTTYFRFARMYLRRCVSEAFLHEGPRSSDRVCFSVVVSVVSSCNVYNHCGG